MHKLIYVNLPVAGLETSLDSSGGPGRELMYVDSAAAAAS
jgi:predicted lactoylglutathione lyase